MSDLIFFNKPPWWHVLKNPPDKEFEIQELIDSGYKRIGLFKKLKEIENSSTKVNSSNYGIFEEFYPGILNKQQGDVQEENYFLGHWFLRMASANSNRIESWLIESEGDLFENLYVSLNSNEQISLFRYISESEKMIAETITLQNEIYIPSEFIKYNYWAIHWTLVPDMVSNKAAALYSGYVIGPSSIFHKQLKKLFEKKLRNNINFLKKNERFLSFAELNKDFSKAVKDIEKEISNTFSNSKSMRYFDQLDVGDLHLTDDLELYPPCMKYLIQDVKNTGYIKHNYRFQLGLFLKKIGMDVNSQLRFWYDLAVDNVGLTFDQFEKRAGYIIRHIYGLEGSKTDYNVPSCKKNMTDYFCLFTHINASDLLIHLPKMYENIIKDKNLDFSQIVDYSQNHRPFEACNNLFNLLYKEKMIIFHPIQWIKSSNKIKSKNQSKES